MATPEIRHFSEALTALSNSAMDVVKDMDQRITASRKMADHLNAIAAHNKQIIERQIILIKSLLVQNAAAEKELKALRDELRSCTTGRSSVSDSAYSTAGQESQSDANDFNLPRLGDVLDKIRIDQSGLSRSRKSFQSDSSLSYSRSPTAPRAHPKTDPIHPPYLKLESSNPLDHSPLKRRRQSAWDLADDDELQSPTSKPRYDGPASA